MSLNNVANGLMGKFAFLACALLLISLGGCAATRYGKQTVKPEYYQDCYAPIAQLRKDADAKARNTALGAAGGALIGAIVGYQEHGAKGAVIGGVAGAVVGGAAAYLITDGIQNKSQDERFAAYSRQMEEDISNLQNAVAAARLTAKCYQTEYKNLEKSYKAGKISKEEMQARLQEIRDGSDDAHSILTKFKAEMAENQAVYQEITKAEAKKGSAGINKKQQRAMRQKEQQLTKAGNDIDKEMAALGRLISSSDSQLKNITAQLGRQAPRAAVNGRHVPVCPAAGSEL